MTGVGSRPVSIRNRARNSCICQICNGSKNVIPRVLNTESMSSLYQLCCCPVSLGKMMCSIHSFLSGAVIARGSSSVML
jgi:hypothetical protein